jgi:D-3-phosphoglycerate dehydrogenase
MADADYVSVHTNLTAETRHLIGAAQLGLMQPSAFILNTSRGPVIDEAALIAALQQGKIAGAGLDVFEQEPIAPDNPLLTMQNVVVLPHSASYSDAAFSRLRRSVAQEAVRVLSGRWPKNVVNKKVSPKKALKKE